MWILRNRLKLKRTDSWNLNIEKPAFSEKPKIDKLALTLTKIETKNYAEHNQIEVNEKTINRLAQAKCWSC